MDDRTRDLEGLLLQLVAAQAKLMQETVDRIERAYRQAAEREVLLYRESIERDDHREQMFWKRLEKAQADKLDVIRLRGENQRELILMAMPLVEKLLADYLRTRDGAPDPVDVEPEPPEAEEAPSSTEPPFGEA